MFLFELLRIFFPETVVLSLSHGALACCRCTLATALAYAVLLVAGLVQHLTW